MVKMAAFLSGLDLAPLVTCPPQSCNLPLVDSQIHPGGQLTQMSGSSLSIFGLHVAVLLFPQKKAHKHGWCVLLVSARSSQKGGVTKDVPPSGRPGGAAHSPRRARLGRGQDGRCAGGRVAGGRGSAGGRGWPLLGPSQTRGWGVGGWVSEFTQRDD